VNPGDMVNLDVLEVDSEIGLWHELSDNGACSQMTGRLDLNEVALVLETVERCCYLFCRVVSPRGVVGWVCADYLQRVTP
jgi:hypothetical protein